MTRPKVIVFLALVTAALAADLPEFIHVCKRSEPDLEACITESINSLRPYLVKGIQEFGVPALEPLHLKELVAVEGSGIKVSGKDINTFGSGDFTVSNLKIDLDQLFVEANVDLPHLYIDGMYQVDGKVLLLPITGSGQIRGNFTKCTGSIRVEGELRKDDEGLDHLYCTKFDMTISVGEGSVTLENLFGGERVLGDLVNSAINTNFEVVIREIKPLIEKALAEVFLDIANHIVNPFTFQQLFPET